MNQSYEASHLSPSLDPSATQSLLCLLRTSVRFVGFLVNDLKGAPFWGEAGDFLPSCFYLRGFLPWVPHFFGGLEGRIFFEKQVTSCHPAFRGAFLPVMPLLGGL